MFCLHVPHFQSIIWTSFRGFLYVSEVMDNFKRVTLKHIKGHSVRLISLGRWVTRASRRSHLLRVRIDKNVNSSECIFHEVIIPLTEHSFSFFKAIRLLLSISMLRLLNVVQVLQPISVQSTRSVGTLNHHPVIPFGNPSTAIASVVVNELVVIIN